MGSDRNVVILSDDIDLVSRMRNEMDLRIAEEKGWHDIAHCELHGGHGGGAADRASWFFQPISYGRFSQFGFTQHRRRVAIELFAGICHAEPP